MDVLEKARARRAAARAAAERAALDWQDAVVESIDQLVIQLGVAGADRLASFEAAVRPAVDGEAWEEREDLVGASFASAHGIRKFSPSDDEHWATSVELWDDLRSALARIHGTDVPASLVVDLDARVAVGYEPLYCPDVGVEPDLVLHLVRGDHDEPFANLLLDVPDPDSAIDRVVQLLDKYGLEPPTRPEHEPGQCDLGLGDEDE